MKNLSGIFENQQNFEKNKQKNCYKHATWSIKFFWLLG